MDEKLVTQEEFLSKMSEFYNGSSTAEINTAIMNNKGYVFNNAWPDSEDNFNKCLPRFVGNKTYGVVNGEGVWERVHNSYVSSFTTTSYTGGEVFDYTETDPFFFNGDLQNNQLMTLGDFSLNSKHINIINMVKTIQINFTTYYDGGLTDSQISGATIYNVSPKCYELTEGIKGRKIWSRGGLIRTDTTLKNGNSITPINSKLFVEEDNGIKTIGFAASVKQANSTSVYQMHSGKFNLTGSSNQRYVFYPGITQILEEPAEGYELAQTAFNLEPTVSGINKTHENMKLGLTIAWCRPKVKNMLHLNLKDFHNKSSEGYTFTTGGSVVTNGEYGNQISLQLIEPTTNTGSKQCIVRNAALSILFSHTNSQNTVTATHNYRKILPNYASYSTYEAWSYSNYTTHHINIDKTLITNLYADGTRLIGEIGTYRNLVFQNAQKLWLELENTSSLPSLANLSGMSEYIYDSDMVGLRVYVATEFQNSTGYSIKVALFQNINSSAYVTITIPAGVTAQFAVTPKFSVRIPTLPNVGMGTMFGIFLDGERITGGIITSSTEKLFNLVTVANENNTSGELFPLKGGTRIQIKSGF